MKQKYYEIWRHEGSQTWRVFTNMTEALRMTLMNTGWNPVIHYKKEAADDHGACPEEVLRRLSSDDGNK